MLPNSQVDASEHMSKVSSGVDGFFPIVKKSPLAVSKKIYEFYTAPITKFWMHTVCLVILSFNIFVIAICDFYLARLCKT